MAKPKYDLEPGELIILKASNVRHGFWGSYTNELVLTNQCIILVKLGMLGNSKEVIRYPLSDVRQAIVGQAQNGEKQLEVHMVKGMEDFAFLSRNDRELRTWAMAISDRFSENSDMYDFNYYQTFLDDNIPATVYDDGEDTDDELIVGGKFLGNIAKSMIKTGDFSARGVTKGLKKAVRKQKMNSIGSTLSQGLKDELGITDIQDDFTEIGNEFREAFGLKPKMTQREMKEQKLNATFDKKVAQARQNAQARWYQEHVQSYDGASGSSASSMSIDEQIEAIKKLKDLMDSGILTQEEFEKKKREIMDL